MKRLLWCMGWPAAYFRRLHNAIDGLPGIQSKYLYYPYNSALTHTRRYEEGALSSNAIVVDRTNRKDVQHIIADYLSDPNAVVVLCGTYPRALLSIIRKLPKAQCVTYYCSDDNIFDRMPGNILSRYYQKWVLNSFDGYLQFGSATACFHTSIIGVKKLQNRHLVHFPCPHFRDEIECGEKIICPNGVVRFLYLGRIVPVKNVIAIVSAAGLLLKMGITNFKIEIAGDGECVDSLRNAIELYGLQDKVLLSGIVSTNERCHIFNRNDVFVLPSHREPWGLVVNEALTAGLPVITPYWTGAALDLVVDGITGVKMKQNDAKTIADVLMTYCQNPESVIKQSERTSSWVIEHKFTHDSCLDAIRKICS